MSSWGIVGIGIVAFDLDHGQSLETCYPSDIPISSKIKQTIAYLALPHTNKEGEGDTQYCFRYRIDDDNTYLSTTTHRYEYGFVFFRQKKDSTLTRGYFQKSIVLLTTIPCISVFEKVSRIIGPIIFDTDTTLPAIYQDIQHWPPPRKGSSMDLQVAGIQFKCTIPAHFDTLEDTQERRARHSLGEAPGLEDIFNIPFSSGGQIFQNIGLYSGFRGAESLLWHLWQIAILGESLLIVCSNAQSCSRAVLSFTSLITPVAFHGDFRPYFTIYDPDFHEISHSQKGAKHDLPTIIIGTTDPFFLKALHFYPNVLYLGGTGTENGSPRRSPIRSTTRSMSPSKESMKNMKCIHKHINKTAPLDSLNLLGDDRSKLFCRRSTLVVPDQEILRQLRVPSNKEDEESTNDEYNQPYILINDAMLRNYFQSMTETFLRPFDRYFTLDCGRATTIDPYTTPENLLLDFNVDEYLKYVKGKVPDPFKSWNWKKLYRRFITESPHFKAWFSGKRAHSRDDLYAMLGMLRKSVDTHSILRGKDGEILSKSALRALSNRIVEAIATEKARLDSDEELLRCMESHVEAIAVHL